MSSKIELVVKTRERDLGGFTVRRLLPYATHRMVGPFIFFDHMGPATLTPGQGMDVRPHPHIGLATVTYLFEGVIFHRDSLGSAQAIRPGAINWMTAGKGIVHSERTPQPERDQGGLVHGIQLWVALPEDHEETEPSFTHYPASSLPELKVDQVTVKLLVGRLFGYTSPVKTHSDLFYAEVKLKKGQRITLPAEGRESAAYLVSGQFLVEDENLSAAGLVIAKNGQDLEFEAVIDSHVMFLGGSPVGERLIWWNLVASTESKLETARANWRSGPTASNPLFKPIPGDDLEFIPLPEEPGVKNPKGTPL